MSRHLVVPMKRIGEEEVRMITLEGMTTLLRMASSTTGIIGMVGTDTLTPVMTAMPTVPMVGRSYITMMAATVARDPRVIGDRTKASTMMFARC
ncbi:MAG TPA: hypothetical protein VNJ08_14860 [Bacteriovoracaceae bacterium]|nr:hypothetical protein [Bacteriovoracaceae bacterium]